MAGDTKIVSDLKKINAVQDKEGIQLSKGTAYFGSSIILHHGEKGGDYQYPIQQWVSNLTIQESLFQNGILGHLDLNDPWNLIRNGIILGQELLFFKFCTQGADQAGLEKDWAIDYSEQPFHVYKITNLQEYPTATGKSSLSGLIYRLHFCSPEMLVNSRIRISKTMQGTISDMVKNILEKDLQTSKELKIEATDDLKHTIIPNISPIVAIKTILAPIAQKTVKSVMTPSGRFPSSPTIFKGRYTDYYFWETTRGYKFLPCIKPEVDTELAFTVGSYPDNPGWWQQMLTGRNHKYLDTLNTLDSVHSGAWGSKQISHNSFYKSYSIYQSNYHRSLYDEKFSHASKTPVYETEKFTRNRDDEDRMISDWPDGMLLMNSFGGQRNTTINKTSRESHHPWKHTPAQASMQRSMQLYHALRYNQLSVVINGISALEAGTIIKLELPNIGEGSGFLGTSKPASTWENRLSNLWIITEIKHIIEPSATTNHYRCELILSNTMGATKDVLPLYDKLGRSSTGFNALWT